MVIPINGSCCPGMDIPPGPPPASLAPRFKVLKVCVIALLIGTFLQLFAGLINGDVFNTLLGVFNILINVLCGIWLFRYDEHIGRIHAWMLRTCCQSCADQGQCETGGMSCLMPFVIVNLITTVLNVLPAPIGADVLTQLSVGFDLISMAKSTTMLSLGLGLMFVGLLMTTLAMIVAITFGYLAYKDYQALGITRTEGDSDWRPGGSQSMQSITPTAPPQQQALFQGTGNRLGS